MKRIETLDKAGMRATREAMDLALGPLSDDIGIICRVTRGTYDPSGGFGHFKVEIKVEGAPSPEATEFVRMANAGVIPFDAEDLNKVIEVGGRKYTVDGYNLRPRKNPVHVTDLSNGKPYLISVEATERALKAHAKASA